MVEVLDDILCVDERAIREAGQLVHAACYAR